MSRVRLTNLKSISLSQLSFSGCHPTICALGSGDRRGYTIANVDATDHPSLGAVTCAAGYHGTAIAKCARENGPFAFEGCTENVCISTSASDRARVNQGVAVPLDTATTVSALRAAAMAPAAGYDDCGCPPSHGYVEDSHGVGSCVAGEVTTVEDAVSAATVGWAFLLLLRL